MTTSSKKPSLKSVKAETKKPALVLSNAQLSSVNDVILALTRADEFNRSKDESLHMACEAFAKGVGINPSYELWNLFNETVKNGLIKARKLSDASAEVYMVQVRKLLKVLFALEKPKQITASALSMAKARNELSAKSEAELHKALEAYAKAGKYKEAAKTQQELEKREKAKNKEAEKNTTSATKALKNDIKKWINNMSTNELALLAWVKANPEPVVKLYQQQQS